MIIGDRLREMREAKKLSQGDVEKRTGLLRCYISRVENGHTVPAVETLEKLARAFEVPLYQLFYEGKEPPKLTGIGLLLIGAGALGTSPQLEFGRFPRVLEATLMQSQDLRITFLSLSRDSPPFS